MAREPQTRPQQTATALASPLQKRSKYLAQALAEMSKEPQRIAGYGDLGARLLAQAITQSASEKTDRALGAEAANADLARRRAIASGVGIKIPGEMQEVGSGRLGNPIAPILRAGRNLFGGGDAPQPAPAASNAAPMPPKEYFNPQVASVPPVENGGALPPVGMMPPPQDPRMGPSPAQDPRLGPAPAQPAAMPQQQAGPPPQLVQQVNRLLAQRTPEAYAQAEAIVQDYQQREMILASLTPEQRANPDFVYAALNAPQELGSNVAKGFAPVTGAAGSSIITPNTGRRFDVPNYQVVNDTVFRTQGGDIGVAATAPPGYGDITERNKSEQTQPVNVPQGSGLYGFDPTQPGGAVNPLVAPQVGAQGNPMDRLAPQERGMITMAGTAAQQARNRISDLERFQTLNRERGTGVLPGLAGPVAGIDPIYAQMRQLEAKLTPREREPGSGPMSDRDIDLYKRAVPRLGNPGTANDAIVAAGVAMSQRDIEYAAFLEEWAIRNGTLLGSTESWQQYVDQNPLLEETRGGGVALRQEVTPWRTYFGYGDQQQRGSGQQGGGPVQINTEAEYRDLAPGSPYIAPDGQLRTKQ